MSTVGPVDHITRAVLPWRTEADLTECGKPVPNYAGRLVTREEAQKRVRQLGEYRASFTLCVTCMQTSDRHGEARVWNRPDAVMAVARATAAVQYAYPPTQGREVTAQWVERDRLNAELEAIAALVREHRDEFDAFLAGRADTVSLAEARSRRNPQRRSRR